MKIERNIPIPTRKRKSKYEFEKMKVGDSFFVRCAKKAVASKRGNVYTAMRRYWDENPKTLFKILAVDGGLRCWRVK